MARNNFSYIGNRSTPELTEHILTSGETLVCHLFGAFNLAAEHHRSDFPIYFTSALADVFCVLINSAGGKLLISRNRF